MRYDLLVHLFVMLGITLIPIKKSRYVWGWLLLLPFVVEAAHLFMPSRTADWKDLVFGLGGVICGWCLITLYREITPTLRRYTRRQRNMRGLKWIR